MFGIALAATAPTLLARQGLAWRLAARAK